MDHLRLSSETVEDLIVILSRGSLGLWKVDTHSGQHVRKEEFVGKTQAYLNRSQEK